MRENTVNLMLLLTFIAVRYCFWFCSAIITNVTQLQIMDPLSFLSSQYLCFLITSNTLFVICKYDRVPFRSEFHITSSTG